MTSSDGAFVRGVAGPVSAGTGQVWRPLRRVFPARSLYGADSACDLRHVPVGRVGQSVGLANSPAKKHFWTMGYRRARLPLPRHPNRMKSSAPCWQRKPWLAFRSSQYECATDTRNAWVPKDTTPQTAVCNSVANSEIGCGERWPASSLKRATSAQAELMWIRVAFSTTKAPILSRRSLRVGTLVRPVNSQGACLTSALVTGLARPKDNRRPRRTQGYDKQQNELRGERQCCFQCDAIWGSYSRILVTVWVRRRLEVVS